MNKLLQVFVLIPLFGFLISMLLPRKNERRIATFAITTIVIHLVLSLVFVVYWLLNGFPILDSKHIVFFKSHDIEIFIDFYFDKVSAVYAVVGAGITLLVTIFSRFYIHREEGFKRYFNTILLFFLGYNLIIFSGNFETLFMGWEILGICSFLLIAFYRDRYLPAKNALKVISVYRLGDIFLILAMWMSHQVWHENIVFSKFNDLQLVQQHVEGYYEYAVFLAVALFLAACTKSAQLPFSSWLPRAMEGPTTSSAVFYGSLSVHLGVFLLLRTYAYWQDILFIKILVIAIGVATSLLATSIARVQSTVKTQIAYSSITQIGFMFIEVALGLHTLALVHFAANAFLRTYQLLVSPSVLSYLIHDMVFSFKPVTHRPDGSFVAKLKNSLYILSIKEFNLDTSLHRFLWTPFKTIGMRLNFLTTKFFYIFLALLFAAGVYANVNEQSIGVGLYKYLPTLFSLIGLLLILKSFTERQNAQRAWILIIAAQLFISLSILLFHENFGQNHVLIYLSGTVVSAIVGYICLNRIKTIESEIDLNRFHGHSYEYPVVGFLFLLSCLGLVGFPFTPTFIGVDLVFSHIHKEEILLIIFISLSFLFMELAALRIYARIFMGQHKKNYHPIAYRSS